VELEGLQKMMEVVVREELGVEVFALSIPGESYCVLLVRGYKNNINVWHFLQESQEGEHLYQREVEEQSVQL